MLLGKLIVGLLDIFTIGILGNTQYGIVVLQQPAGDAQEPGRVGGGDGAEQLFGQGEHAVQDIFWKITKYQL